MILLNGVELTNYILDTPFSDTIDEELDKQNIQIKSNTRINFKKNDKLEYIVKQNVDNNTQREIIRKVFCVFGINETYEGLIWVYQLTLLSPTKLLENIIVNGMAETYATAQSQTLKQQIERVISKINKQEYYEKATPISIIKDNNDAFNSLSSKNANDFLWSGQLTAREILQDVCDKADCLIIATDFSFSSGNITQIKIKAEPREKEGTRLFTTYYDIEEGGLNAINKVLKGYSTTFDSEFNNGNIISLTKNAICKDNVQQTYLPARNDDMTIDDSADWHILTQEPIYTLNSVKVLVDISNCIMRVKNPDDTTKYEINGIALTAYVDITDYIVEKDVFDTLPTKIQKKRLYFKRGEKGIYGLYKRYKQNPLWSNEAIDNILNDWDSNTFGLGVPLTPITSASWFASDKFGHFNSDMSTFTPATSDPIITGDTYYVNYGQPSDITPSNFYYNGFSSIMGIINKKNLLFSVNYQPYCDSVVKIEKTKINELEGNCKNLSILKNQSDRTIDASKYYDSQKALINRLGNKEMVFDCIFDLSEVIKSDLSNKANILWNLGDNFVMQLKQWTLTKREIQNYGDNKLKCRMTFSQFYNASNSAINLNRDKRLYGIPLNQYVDRYILIKKPNNKNYTKLLLQCYDDFTANQTESTSDSQMGYCVLDLIKIGNSSIIHKVARCKDNYAVDIERTKYSSTVVNINLRYSDSDGYRTNIITRLLTDDEYNQINITDYSRLPFIQDENYSIQVGDQIILNDIFKDKMERFIFVII